MFQKTHFSQNGNDPVTPSLHSRKFQPFFPHLLFNNYCSLIIPPSGRKLHGPIFPSLPFVSTVAYWNRVQRARKRGPFFWQLKSFTARPLLFFNQRHQLINLYCFLLLADGDLRKVRAESSVQGPTFWASNRHRP